MDLLRFGVDLIVVLAGSFVFLLCLFSVDGK